jgi:hypothetical protein
VSRLRLGCLSNVFHKPKCGPITTGSFGRAVEYLLNLHLFDRRIWTTRNGESLDDVVGKLVEILSWIQKGEKFAGALSRSIESQRCAFPRNGQLAMPSKWSVRSKMHEEVDLNRQ